LIQTHLVFEIFYFYICTRIYASPVRYSFVICNESFGQKLRKWGYLQLFIVIYELLAFKENLAKYYKNYKGTYILYGLSEKQLKKCRFFSGEFLTQLRLIIE
jgi:hypothetical protein